MTGIVDAKPLKDSRSGMRKLGMLALFGLACAAAPCGAAPVGVASNNQTHALFRLQLPKLGLNPDELAVVVNDADPLSVQIADYYRLRRGIPDANVIHVTFRAGATLAPEAFARVRQEIDRQTPAQVQAYALSWTTPYRVGCMSITSALAFGFDQAYCSTRCGGTRPSGYFDSRSTAPYADLGFRPAMMLAGRTFNSVKALIDRGAASDATYPAGTGYLLKTADQARSVRAVTFETTVAQLGQAFQLELIEAEFIRDKKNVLFYFTGLAEVPHLDTLRFLPGAIADHLTSVGGQLTGDSQMSSMKWLEAGATGSYGTVVEPCNRLQKFPFPAVVMAHYAAGETLLEAYWKSVAWPGEGVFIGEPLARPYRAQLIPRDDRHMRVTLFAPVRSEMGLEQSASPVGPYRLTDVRYALQPGFNALDIDLPDGEAFFRLTYDINPVRAVGSGQPQRVGGS